MYTNFGASLENYYHWLRFTCFPKSSKEEIRGLVSGMLDVDVRSVQDKLQKKSIPQLLSILKNARKSSIPIQNKTKILDAYFFEEEKDLSYMLLRFLLFSPFDSPEALDTWMQQYQKSTYEDREEMIPKVIYSSRFI